MADEFDDDEPGGDADEEATVAVPAPRETSDLVGQERAEATLLEAWRSGRLPHAWLLTGPRGIGKATLAFRFARFLFARTGEGQGLFAAQPRSLAVDPSHPVFRRVAAGDHADLLVVERGYDPKRRRRRGEIVVDDVRQIADFLHLTPAEGGWRVVVVDGADEMNRNAANAMLKMLEEPSPRALLLITSVGAGRLLPTVRSRCRHLALDLISNEQIIEFLNKYHPPLAPDAAAGLADLAAGSIGRALDLAASDGLALYREINGLLDELPNLDGVAVDRLADRVGRVGAEDSFRLLAELLTGRIARLVAAAARGEDTASEGPIARPSLDRWIEVWDNLNRIFALVDVVNLDRKEAVLNAFFALEEAAR
jgi:DNA polymerase III subunit delta'